MPASGLFPTEIRLLGHTFRIQDIAVLRDKIEKDKGGPCTGYSDWDTQSIYIDFTRPASDQVQIFFHELLHCYSHIVTNGDLFPPKQEEAMIEVLACGLTSTILDNGDLWNHLLKNLKKSASLRS